MKEYIEQHFLRNGKLNPWCTREEWIEKNNHQDAIEKIDKLIDGDYSLRDKIIVILYYDGKIPECKICGKRTKYHASSKRFALYCSIKCTNNDPIRNETRVMDQEKLKAGMLKKYNVDNIMKVDGFAKFGDDNPSKRKDVREKISLALKGKKKVYRSGIHPSQAKYTEEQFDYLNNPELILQKQKEMEVSIFVLSEKLGFNRLTLSNVLFKNGLEPLYFSRSNGEKEIEDFIKTLNFKTVSNSRQLISPMEIDIYVPVKGVGIEYCGEYWHCDLNKTRTYHYNKYKMAKERNIRLLQFFESEWLYKQDICKSIIKSALDIFDFKLYARNTEFRFIDSNVYNKFCNENHIHGSRNASIRGGLFYNNELVSIMGFNKTGEMVRYCTLLNMQIVGGLSKLFKNLLSVLPDTLYTFADLRFYEGSSYEQLGFIFDYKTPVNYWYFDKKNGLLKSRLKYQKHKLPTLLEKFDENLSEYENMLNNNFLRIYDCGSYKYIYRQNTNQGV